MDPRGRAPYKTIGVIALTVLVLLALGVYLQFTGDLVAKTKLTLVSPRAGLVMDTSAKVTYNGVQIGRVSSISEFTQDRVPAAKLVLDVDPKYVAQIPDNVVVDIKATTVFGNKYVALSSPKMPSAQHIMTSTVLYATAVTTEFNTLFETLVSISEKIDPVKVNLTLSATAQALSGLGDKFGASLVNGDTILDDLNPQMPQARYDIQLLAALGDLYADAAPDLWDALDHAVITARTVDRQQRDLDAALLKAAGVGNSGAEVFGRAGPFFSRGAADLLTTGQLLDEYSPEILCTIRNFHDVAPKITEDLAGNGYSLGAHSGGSIAGAPNPYMWPDNLPRVNARGGPGGRPGCWKTITRDLWPAPLLVMDVGASLAPYNHFDIGSPYALDYVWGRQVGDYTINP